MILYYNDTDLQTVLSKMKEYKDTEPIEWKRNSFGCDLSIIDYEFRFTDYKTAWIKMCNSDIFREAIGKPVRFTLDWVLVED